MANEISWRYSETGSTVYFTIRSSARTMWNGSALETLTVANWGNYDIAMTETPASSYFYVGTWPAGLSTVGWYYIDVYLQIGGSPAITDTIIATLYGYWNGTKFEPAGGDITEISSDNVAANNLELQFDTTGLTGNTFPATQLQATTISGNVDVAVSTRSIAGDAMTLTAAYDAAKTAAQAGNQMALTAAAQTTLVTAIWAASVRTLSTFGTLVSDIATAIWSAVARTLTAIPTGGATEANVTSVKNVVDTINTNVDAKISTRSTLTAQQVWEYSTRALTTFGTLVAQIATAVWAAAIRTLTSDAAPTVAEIDTQLSNSHGAGSWESTAVSGSNTVTITIKETDTNGDPIPTARVCIRNSTGETILDSKYTDTNGEAEFSLDDGTYKVYIDKVNDYSFTTPETLTVSGDTTEEFFGTALSPSEPSDPTICRLYGYLIDVQGTAISGATVEAKVVGKAIWATTGQLIKEAKVSTTSNASGYWYLDLIRSAQLEGENEYQINIPIINYKNTITIPDVGTKKLYDIDNA